MHASKKVVKSSTLESAILPFNREYSSYQSEMTADKRAWEIFESGFSIMSEIKMSASGSRKPWINFAVVRASQVPRYCCKAKNEKSKLYYSGVFRFCRNEWRFEQFDGFILLQRPLLNQHFIIVDSTIMEFWV